MRFNKLTLQAFVSFKNKTVIDFKQFGNNLLLLFGGSGEGKTTIFDGVSFALFGKCSGSDRSDMALESYHSDYAKVLDDKEKVVKRYPLEVELEFEHNGKIYVATRKITWKSSGTSANYKYEMTLTEDGKVVAMDSKEANTGTYKNNKNDKVTDYVEELLGLNAMQFGQVVILAQGEFEKFLKADAAEREKILTRLVDTNAYKDFENRLKLAKNALSKEQETLLKDIGKELEQLKKCPTTTDAEKLQYSSKDPSVLQDLKDNLDTKSNSLDSKQQELKDKREEQLAKAGTYGELKIANDFYRKQKNKLDTAVAELKKLDLQQAGIDKLQQENILLDKLVQIFPLEKQKNEAAEAVQENARLIGELTKSVAALQKQETSLKQSKEAVETANNPMIQDYNTKVRNLNGIMGVYDQLQKAKSTQKTMQGNLNGYQGKVDDINKELDEEEPKLTTAEDQLAALKDEGQAKVDLCKQALDSKDEECTALGNLEKDIEAALGYETNLINAQADKKAWEKKKNDALQEYDRCRIALQKAQREHSAGELAEYMRKELAQNAQVECPVCHTIHYNAAKLELKHQLPEEKALKTADKAYAAALEKLGKAEKEEGKQQGIYAEAVKHVLEDAAKLLGQDYTWEQLKNLEEAANPVKVAQDRAGKEKQQCNEAWEEADKKAGKKKKLESDITALKRKIDKLKTDKGDWEKKHKTEAGKKATVDAEVNSLEGQLKDYPATKAEAEGARDKYQDESEKLQKKVTDAVTEYNKCSNQLATDRGKLGQEKAKTAGLDQKKVDAEQALAQTLQACGFQQEQDYKTEAALYTDSTGKRMELGKLQELKRKNQAAIETHKDALAQWTRSKKDAEDTLVGKHEVDLTALKTELENLDKDIKKLDSTVKELAGDLRVHNDVYNNVKQLFKENERKQKVFEVLSAMVSKVCGSNKNDLSFNRFVLNDLFQTMLDCANNRLGILSSGQFELQPVMVGDDSNSTTGLDFTVHDCINQTNRASGSNSGGEKFEISLSLALGLSDIVQSHGKKASRIDSLFIDEGFGTLGKEDLAKTTKLLLELSGGTRQIGIISHNTVLEEAIHNQIRVSKNKQDREGSKITYMKE